MANFHTHVSVGFVVSGVLALLSFKAGTISDNEFATATLIGTVGSLLPDIDSDKSTPAKIGFNLLSIMVVFAVLSHWREQLSFIAMLITWAVGYVLVRYGLFWVFGRVTVHRGMIHSVPFMALLGLALVCLNFYGFANSAFISWFYGSMLFLGSLVHLILDELYSVNLLGLKIKRSSGTAMKFYQSKYPWRYAILYALVATLWFIAPSFGQFWATLSDPISWLLIKKAMI